MCDESTEAENEVYLERVRLSRREVSMGAGATLAAALTGCTSTPVPTNEPEAQPPSEKTSSGEILGRMVVIETPDGAAEAFFATPKDGQHPGVIVWPDVAGLRDAFKAMATRLAGEGYAVLAVNHYYRSSKMPVLTTFSEWKTKEGEEKIRPMREALSPEGITSDGAAFAGWLDQQKEVDKGRKLATTGYCMGGPFTFRTAAAIPARVGVIASFHGGGLVTDEPASPHALFPKIKAAALICIAQNDDQRQPEAKTTLQQAAAQAKLSAEIEVYPAQHGWCVPDSPVYDKEQAERAWARALATLERYL
jgi:carboxymethylenebutenolidase